MFDNEIIFLFLETFDLFSTVISTDVDSRLVTEGSFSRFFPFVFDMTVSESSNLKF